MTKLKTSFFANLTLGNVTPPGTGKFTGYLNLGSCFDPCGSFTDIQPAGFDQLAALWGRYLVTGATVRIRFCGTGFSQTDPIAYQW